MIAIRSSTPLQVLLFYPDGKKSSSTEGHLAPPGLPAPGGNGNPQGQGQVLHLPIPPVPLPAGGNGTLSGLNLCNCITAWY